MTEPLINEFIPKLSFIKISDLYWHTNDYIYSSSIYPLNQYINYYEKKYSLHHISVKSEVTYNYSRVMLFIQFNDPADEAEFIMQETAKQ